MIQRLKLMADYDCWPLWDLDSPQNIDPASLGLSDDLRSALSAWSASYNDILNRETGEASFNSEADEIAFNQQGHDLLAALKKELPEAEIAYFDHKTHKLINAD